MSETYAVGDRIWRWSRGYGSDTRPAVVVKVSAISGEVSSISSKSSANADEKPQVHRITRSGASGARGARKMTPIEAERAADLEEWHALKLLRADHDRRLVVAHVRVSTYMDLVVTLDAVPRLRAELDTAERLLQREAKRTADEKGTP